MLDSGASAAVLMVSSNLCIQTTFSDVLAGCGLTVIVAQTSAEADETLRRLRISVVFCSDELLNGGVDQLLLRTLGASKRVPFIGVSRLNDWERCREFLERGALDCVLYPFGKVEVERIVNNATNLAQLKSMWEYTPNRSISH